MAARARRPKELTNSPFLTCGLRILRRLPPSHATTLSPDKRGNAPHPIVLVGPPHLGRCQPLETMSKADGMQDASPIITSVWLWRPPVRQTIHLRASLYRIGIAASDRFPSELLLTNSAAGGRLWALARPSVGWMECDGRAHEGRKADNNNKAEALGQHLCHAKFIKKTSFI